MAVKAAPASYFRLVERFPLTSIRDDDHLCQAIAMLNEVLAARKDRGTELYLDALTDLVETYERDHEPLGETSQADVLRELMRLHGLTQQGLEAAVGIAQSTISAVLNGKRALTVDQMIALADHFATSPSVFLPAHSPRPAQTGPGRTRTVKTERQGAID
jgi:HTH-type transcriptional regulator/antitoxin HigA